MKKRPIVVTNTLSGKKEPLETLNPGKMTFYSCGPTVYGLIHIGNLRGGLVSDLFFRYFKRCGYDVTYVRNYTDVDDKIIKKAKEEGISPEELATKYTLEVEKDYKMAGMLEPTHKTTVTTHMPEIIEMIQKLLDEKKAYSVAQSDQNQEVLYSIQSFEGYGKLSQRNVEDLKAGARVDVRDLKRDPLDFTLWKPAKPGEPSWESPWGPGRPGWHIECSAMARKWLGDQIDIHHGGEDLIFPHHENEIAQTEGATGKDPFVRYWLHHAFLTLSKEKMSKSLGNIFTAREFLTQFSGELARFILLGVHYRSVIDFTNDTLEQGLAGLYRIYETKEKAVSLLRGFRFKSDPRAEGVWGEFVSRCEAAKKTIDDQYAQDFNTPGVLAALYGLIREFNRTVSEPSAMATPSVALGAQALIEVIEKDVGGVLGIGTLEPKEALKEIARMREVQKKFMGQKIALDRPSEDEIQKLIAERNLARKEKNFGKADEIRNTLQDRGVQIKDGPHGTTWEYL